MKDKITLDTLFQTLEEEFPTYEHSRELFIHYILEELQKDISRTGTIYKQIEKEKTSFEILRSWPMNDFLDGSYNYLICIKVPQENAADFRRKYSFGKSNLLYE